MDLLAVDNAIEQNHTVHQSVHSLCPIVQQLIEARKFGNKEDTIDVVCENIIGMNLPKQHNN
jgi:hypothetical protein